MLYVIVNKIVVSYILYRNKHIFFPRNLKCENSIKLHPS